MEVNMIVLPSRLIIGVAEALVPPAVRDEAL
jgi:hypothetical protein